MNWFNKVLEFLKNLFQQKNITENPFRQAAQMILEAETDGLNTDLTEDTELYQLSELKHFMQKGFEKAITLENLLSGEIAGKKTTVKNKSKNKGGKNKFLLFCAKDF